MPTSSRDNWIGPLFRQRYPVVQCHGCGRPYPDYTPVGCAQPEQCLNFEVTSRIGLP